MIIKMSEDFELPIKIQDVIDAPEYGHCTSIVEAVNAYDANQERIAELDKIRVGSMVRITLQSDEITEQQQEIELLKKQNSQLKSENDSIAAYADQRINMLTRANRKLGGES